jgi:hypothetical protein
MGLALGLLVLGIVASWLGSSILPLIVIVAVVWCVGSFMRGFSGPR